MKTSFVEVASHQFRFLMKGYKGLDFYVSEPFFLVPWYSFRYLLVQRDDGAELLLFLALDIKIVHHCGFTEEEVDDIYGAVSRKSPMYYHVFQ